MHQNQQRSLHLASPQEIPSRPMEECRTPPSLSCSWRISAASRRPFTGQAHPYSSQFATAQHGLRLKWGLSGTNLTRLPAKIHPATKERFSDAQNLTLAWPFPIRRSKTFCCSATSPTSMPSEVHGQQLPESPSQHGLHQES